MLHSFSLATSDPFSYHYRLPKVSTFSNPYKHEAEYGVHVKYFVRSVIMATYEEEVMYNTG